MLAHHGHFCDLYLLGILYESFIHPITILSGPAVRGFRRSSDSVRLPLGCTQRLGLAHARYESDIYGFGHHQLIGIVKKNAIMMIDFALEAQRKDGKMSRRGDLIKAAWCDSAPS